MILQQTKEEAKKLLVLRAMEEEWEEVLDLAFHLLMPRAAPEFIALEKKNKKKRRN